MNIRCKHLHLLVACTCLLLTACGQEQVASQEEAVPPETTIPALSVSNANVVHGSTPLEYVLSWQGASTDDVAVDIYVSDTPHSASSAALLTKNALDQTLSGVDKPANDKSITDTAYNVTPIVKGAIGGSYTWTAPAPAKRRYFSIVDPKGEITNVAVRLLPLEGGRNFRDLGGYITSDGRRVKWGKVYRSGVMSGLTDNDYNYLKSLGITTVCDYRAADERTDQPTQWRAGEIEYVTFPDPESKSGSSFMSVLQEPDVTPDKVSNAMANGYAQIAKQQSDSYAYMFDQLAAGNIPLAFNCSAGKDRAGMSAALLLTALGVPRETVVEDYAMSDKVVDYMQEFLSDNTADAEDDKRPYGYLSRLPRELVAPLMRSDPLYVQTALNDLATEYGSVINFIQSELEVTEAELKSIRTQLLN